jgi:hypothetical protein
LNVGITLELTKRTDPRLLERMARHYSQPGGFVGRNRCFAVLFDGEYYGHIVSGSAVRFLPGRNEALGVGLGNLNGVVNNVFYSLERRGDAPYPLRNFTSAVVKAWERIAADDWQQAYGDAVVGYETLVELPRRGECYRRAGWVEVGTTFGYTCKRVGGKGTDSWTGKRVWNTDKSQLRPKLVLVKPLAHQPQQEEA